jgi:hypothetical protein
MTLPPIAPRSELRHRRAQRRRRAFLVGLAVVVALFVAGGAAVALLGGGDDRADASHSTASTRGTSTSTAPATTVAPATATPAPTTLSPGTLTAIDISRRYAVGTSQAVLPPEFGGDPGHVLGVGLQPHPGDFPAYEVSGGEIGESLGIYILTGEILSRSGHADDNEDFHKVFSFGGGLDLSVAVPIPENPGIVNPVLRDDFRGLQVLVGSRLDRLGEQARELI